MSDPTDEDAAVWRFEPDPQTDMDALEVRLVNIERALLQAANTIRAHRQSLDELFARVDRLTEQVELQLGSGR